MITIVEVGPRPADVAEALRTVLDVGARRAAELVELVPAYIGVQPALADVLREELERAGAVVEGRTAPSPPRAHAAVTATSTRGRAHRVRMAARNGG